MAFRTTGSKYSFVSNNLGTNFGIGTELGQIAIASSWISVDISVSIFSFPIQSIFGSMCFSPSFSYSEYYYYERL